MIKTFLVSYFYLPIKDFYLQIKIFGRESPRESPNEKNDSLKIWFNLDDFKWSLWPEEPNLQKLEK